MPVPPTGTVTFLFTDIEGSTRMWERDAAAMQVALARHDEILQSTIEERGGYVFKTVGDAFCAAFATATDALEAALVAQRALLAEEWEEGCAIRVRVALHTGAVDERGGDYFGPPVNRVARLLSAGHGGQTLLSLATQELVRDGLPKGTELRDMGERYLKDLFRPEHVFQLLAPDLPSNFPPLKTLDARRNNLPTQPTPLVGRERELGEVAGLVRRGEVRLLTLVGPGGTGKTRLGLQAAAELLDEFEGGVFFVALAPVADPGLVASTIAGALGVIETPERPLVESLKDYLRAREVLLVLDNFEQVVDAAPLVGELLAACPKLTVLATSRVALGVYGEREYAVPPLALPDPARLPSVEHLTQYEAVRLFIERAQAAKAGFEVTSENAPAVAEICVRLDGLPLAIELAAARVKILPPQAMLTRLANRLKLLRGGARDLPERQRTLRGAIDWSHDLLDEEERTLFRRLSVFAGGRTLEAVEEVCDPEGELDALEGVGSMVDKSLIRQEETEGESRFVMLETIHEYAREKLEESGEAEEIKRSHAQYFLALAEEAEPELKGPDQTKWRDRLEREHDNLRAALSWSLESGEAETALRLAGALGLFWTTYGHGTEGLRWTEGALAIGDGNPTARAKALRAAGILALDQGDPDRMTAFYEEELTLGRKAGDMKSIADSLVGLTYAATYRGDPERAEALAEEAVAVSRELGDGWYIGISLTCLAAAKMHQGDRERTTALMEEALMLNREIGDKQGVAASLNNLGYNALSEDPERAAALLEESLALSRELGAWTVYAGTMCSLGWARLLRGEHERAEKLLGESLALSRETGDKVLTAECLEGLAGLAGIREEAERAARLWGAAEALREATAPLSPDEQSLREPYLEEARSRKDEASWTEAWDKGRAMSLDDAVAYALESAPSSEDQDLTEEKI